MKNLCILIAVILLFSTATASAPETGRVVASPGQLFWVNGSWVPANQLHPGDEFRTPDGHVAVVRSIQDVTQEVNASCFSLATFPPGDFFASSILAAAMRPSAEKTLLTPRSHGTLSPTSRMLDMLRYFFHHTFSER